MNELGQSQQMLDHQAKLCGRLSHQLTGPLNTILNGAEYIQASLESGSADQQQEAILLSAHAIQDSAHWLDRLAQNLLDLLAIFSGTLKPAMRPVELCRQLENILKQSLPYAEKQGMTLQWDRDKMPIQAYGMADELLFDKILLNLLSNAILYGKKEGSIQVEFCACGGGYKLSVQDDGPGIPQEIQHQLSDSLKEVNAAEIQNGSGIGLYLVSEFCRAMQWPLQLQSDSAGTKITIEISSEITADPRKISMASGTLFEELRRREQTGRIIREMTALFGELK